MELRDTGARGWTIRGDPDALGRVFDSLLDNALRHTLADGTVSVAGRVADDDAIDVTFTHTGKGIPAEEMPRIFERFYRSDRVRSACGGAGLGLAIAQEIVEAHGGTISVESVVGLGTRFTVRLLVANPTSD